MSAELLDARTDDLEAIWHAYRECLKRGLQVPTILAAVIEASLQDERRAYEENARARQWDSHKEAP